MQDVNKRVLQLRTDVENPAATLQVDEVTLCLGTCVHTILAGYLFLYRMTHHTISLAWLGQM